MNYERKIFTTGAATGLGYEIVSQSKKRNIDIKYHQHKNEIIHNDDFVFGDIRDEQVQESILKTIVDNDINVFINNVGVYLNKSLQESSPTEIYDVLSTNLFSTILLTKKISDLFLLRGYGMIYNINSLAGLRGTKNESIYCASKHGLKGFTDSLSDELKGQKDIRIVNVTLGAFKTKMTMGRPNYDLLGEPNDVANCILDHISQNYSSINNELIITRKN